ncbi:hypothetical protein B0H10DRAFT_1772340 [Mycena sp. CBHHK59/15]|nr:hypothetical protein B0H10DRAFT_1772340 [Mycena sp. CBHHK59/15]
MSNTSSADSHQSLPGTPPEIPTSSTIKLYIVQAKLDAQQISELFALAEKHNMRVSKPRRQSRSNLGDSEPEFKLELCHSPEDSEIIITNVRMKKRLERHLDWNLAKDKAVVTPEWLRDTVQRRTILPCGDYTAVRELQQTTVENCPDSDEECQGSSASFLSVTGSEQPFESHNAHYSSRYACLRLCPLVCPNQGLVQQLGILRRSRELEGKDTSALSYERAISVSYPYALTTSRMAEVSSLPHIGDKILSKVAEYVTEGKIGESQTIEASSRFRSLSAFSSVYGIGPTTARKLYDSGLRSIDDLEEYYDKHPVTARHAGESKLSTRAPVLSIKAALALRVDLDQKIPRAEVDLMHEIVMAELEKLHPGCLSTVVGGYRRGKSESNDVDIVITHPKLVSGSNQIKNLGEKLVNRLYDCGLITHVMHLSGFHVPDALRISHWDSLEKALAVFILPPGRSVTPFQRVHRRLDLIFAAPEAYWTAVTGWTGSKMFERDLRLWAKVERQALHSLVYFPAKATTRRRDSKPFFPRSEKDVFDILGLEWIDPTMRNADM